MERMIAAEGLQGGFVVACPFTTRFYKHWREERWSALIRAVRERTRLGVVLLGGPGDRAAADRIVAGAAAAGGGSPSGDHPPLVDLVGPDHPGRSVRGRFALQRPGRCGHPGSATWHTPSAAPPCFSSASNTPYLDPPGPAATILHSGRSCSPCRGKLTCDGRIDCMTDISVERALAAVTGCLAGCPGPGGRGRRGARARLARRRQRPGGRVSVVHLETGRHLYGGALQVLYLAQGLEERGGSSRS